MWWSVLALLSGSYVDIVNDPAKLRICAAAADLSADDAAKNGGDALDVGAGRSIAKLYFARLREMGAENASAFAAAKKGLSNSDTEMALYEKCQTIAMATPADGTLVDGANEAEAMEEAMNAAADAAEAAATEAAEATADGDVASVEAVEAAHHAALLASLPEERRDETRCTMLASLIVHEIGRHPSTKNYGLTAAKAETLAGLLAEAIMAETGWDAATVRAVFKQDYEEFTFAMLGDGQDEKTAQATLDSAMTGCQPFFAAGPAPVS